MLFMCATDGAISSASHPFDNSKAGVVSYWRRAVQSGVARRESLRPLPPVTNQRQEFFVVQICYILATVPIRASICLSLVRIATMPWHRHVLYTVIGSASLSALITTAVMATNMKHVSTLFTLDHPHTHSSWLVEIFMYLFMAISILEDAVIVVMPPIILHYLQRERRQRRFLSGLLGLGGSACIGTMIRLPFLVGPKGTPAVRGREWILFCTLIELTFAIVCGSLPALKPALQGWTRVGGPDPLRRIDRPFRRGIELRDLRASSRQTAGSEAPIRPN